MGSDNIEAPCLKIYKTLGEKAISLASEMGLYNHDLKIEQVDDHLCIPLICEPSDKELERLTHVLSNFEFVRTKQFSERLKQHSDLVNVLKDKLPDHLQTSIPHAIDFIGKIAVVEIPSELNEYKRDIGAALLSIHGRLHTVLAKSGAVGGIHRVRRFEVIGGTDETETIHREYGCLFYIDLAKAYFSSRLSYERDRIASQVGDAEAVVDMFAGVGPFSVMIAKRHIDAKVYAVDINPDAIYYLKRNIVQNRVENNVEPILGDVELIIKEKLMGVADRVIMNLPERAIEYVDVACKSLKPEGGILHFYTFESSPEPLERAIVRLVAAVKQTERNIERILFKRLVRATSPFVWQVAVDAKIS